jgi:hypothetical protein
MGILDNLESYLELDKKDEAWDHSALASKLFETEVCTNCQCKSE